MEWYRLKEELVWDGYRKITKKIFLKPDGRQADFEIKKEGETVCVLALTAAQKVILAKEFRPGPELTLLELPGGFKDKNEGAEKAARRELLEETGYSGDFQFVVSGPVDAYSDTLKYNFVATNCRKVQESDTEMDEHIEVVEMSLQDFCEHLREGQMTDMATGYLGLDYLNLL